MGADETVRPRDHLATDAVVATVVAAGGLAGYHLAGDAAGSAAPLGWLGYLLLGLGAAALIARRQAPLLTLAVTTAAVTGHLALNVDHEGPFIILPVMVAMYTAAEAGQRGPVIGAASVIVGAFGLRMLLDTPPGAEGEALGLLWATGWLAAAIVAGEVVKSRREYFGAVEARALEAERTREEEGRRRAGEERLRIARELHDVLGHSLSLINVQAGAAAHVIDRDPQQAREALETVRQASKQALDELRGTVGALKQEDGAEPLAPAPSLTRLDELVRSMAHAGVEVGVSVTGDPRPLPAPVDQAAYRIVQESLTNVLRHAGAPTASVRFEHGRRELVIEVSDTGTGAPREQLERGRGVAGMRERATALGGELAVSDGAGKGVRVRARLPLDGAR